ncbi:MAG: hypothetical protein KF873_08365 [Gemmataceae bacterium]|nr:hypothetical protein [Gemmataceae bacterium]
MPFVSIASLFRPGKPQKAARPKSAGLTVQHLEDRSVPAAGLVDRNSTLLGSGNAPATVLDMSDDGRYAIFSSAATDLIQGQVDIPGTNDLFWTDLLTNEIRLVTNLPTVLIDGTTNLTRYDFDRKTTYSKAIPGVDSFGEARLSADGKFVAFSSKLDAALIDGLYITKAISPNSTDITRTTAPDRGNSTFDVFRWSAQTGDTKLVSRTFFNGANAGNPNEAFGRRVDSVNPGISSDGSRVSFVSNYNAQNALPQRTFPAPLAGVIRNTNGAEFLAFDNGDTTADIFMTDLTDIGQPTFVPTTENTGFFFTTVMSKIFSGDVLVLDFDTATGKTAVLARVPGFTTFGALSTTQVRYDPAGRYLGGDGLTATFVSNVDAATLNLRSQAGGTQTKRTYAASTSENVWWTQFGSTTDPANLVRLVTIGSDTTTTGVVNSSGAGGGRAQNSILAGSDTSAVLFTTSVGNTAGSQIVTGFGGDPSQQELYFRRVNGEISDTAILVTAINGSLTTPGNGILPIGDIINNRVDPLSYQISAGAGAVVFTSTSSNIFPAATVKDTNNANDIFVKDLTNNAVEVVSVIPSGKQTGTQAAVRPFIGPDGRYVTFQSTGSDYVAAATTSDTNGALDVLLRDRATKTTAYISTIANGASTGNGASFGAFVGNIGQNGRVVFTSSSTNLDTLFPITPGNTDVYVTILPLAGGGSGDPPLKAPRIGAVSGGSQASASYVTFGSSNEIVLGSRFTPFPGFTGELRVATADVNNDGNATPDMIIAPGPGLLPRVVVIDGASGKIIRDIVVFEPTFTGGLNVAAADIDSDGFADIVVAADVGGGPRVKVISGQTGNTMADFFIFEPAFRGGVRVATGFIGSITGTGAGSSFDDGVPDIIAGAGIGGGPRISVLDGVATSKNQISRITDFFAFELTLRNGVYVGGGDFNRDALDDIVAGGGPGGGPRVQVFETKSLVLTPSAPTTLVNFFAFDPTSRNGVRVSVKNVDGDSTADLIVGEGAGNISRVRTFSGGKLNSANVPNLIDDQVLYADFASTNGAWVG